MKNKLSTFLLLLVFLVGLALLLYPTVSDYYNALHQSRAVATYSDCVAALDAPEYEAMWEAARAYNKKLAQRPVTSFVLSAEENAEYESLFALTEVMSYVEIPSIHCTLPIYHGTSEEVLEAGIGHVEGSSLPTGGESTHCVLSGHRGLPSSKLFTDLDLVAEGDLFFLRTLQETMTYQVDQIRIVEPEELSDLALVPGKDYCTLVTCTPYGVNTQRLLVRGVRVENPAQATSVQPDAVAVEPMLAAPFAAVPLFLVMLFWVLRNPQRKEEPSQ